MHVHLPTITIKRIQFANARPGRNFHYLYQNSDSYPPVPGDMQGWSRGAKITQAEWVRDRAESENHRACFTRNRSVSLVVTLECSTNVQLNGTIRVTPRLDRSSSHLQPVSASFIYPAFLVENSFDLVLGGTMPDEIGRYRLDLEWELSGSGFRFGGPERTRLLVYGIYGQPFQPGDDDEDPAYAGQATTFDEGTLTGTKKRLDKLMRIIGGRRPVTNQDEVIDVLWRLHQGVNDFGNPPYFDAGHNEHLTVDGEDGSEIALEDQWLAWVPSPSTGSRNHWNDASCIGHVQILKTMAAAAGLFCRRSWVFPHTSRLPNGSAAVLADTDLYSLGQWAQSGMQRAQCRAPDGRILTATCKLMEPPDKGYYENYEACLRSPNGRFLPGGYSTRSCPDSFRTNKGFTSAAELLRWWSNTTRPGWGKRFMAWVYDNMLTGEFIIWDVNGRAYTASNYHLIRGANELPPP